MTIFFAALAFVDCSFTKTPGNNSNNTPERIVADSTEKPAKPSPTPEQTNILFIIDSSGSMKEKAGDRTKMDAAKEVVTALIGQLPTGVQAGLMSYGHRKRQDCKDIELLIPIGPVDKEVFGQKVQSLQPLGETPISASLRQAAEVLRDKKGRKTIILISDGEETCKEDPCTVAAELKKAEVDLQVHVVGFGISTPAAKKQLNCIAEATGGTYKDAANAAELKKVLEGIAASAESSGDKGRLVTVGSDFTGQSLEYSIEVFPTGQKQSIDPGVDTWKSTKINEIPPGVYDIKYWSPSLPTVWRRNVEIKAGEETRVDIGKFGRMRVSLKDQGGNAVQMYGNVFLSSDPENQIATINYASTTQDLPAGTYDIQFWNINRPTVWQKGIEIRPGEETTISVTVTK